MGAGAAVEESCGEAVGPRGSAVLGKALLQSLVFLILLRSRRFTSRSEQGIPDVLHVNKSEIQCLGFHLGGS